ncbi:MAG TPA: adenylosuccinate lyase [Synergistaceae bacterium]|nr:adenylosuccinate lyase [Synergistaceae bacterium]
MIDRYATPEMAALWSEEHRFQTWLEVELAACQAWAEEGRIPFEALEDIRRRASFDVERIREIEETTQHDVIAFVSCVAERTGECGRYIHLGLTSSDVIDTASALQLRSSLDVILSSLETLKEAVLSQAWRHKDTLCVGRTHGIHAEPTSFGLKLLNWYDQLRRDTRRLEAAREEIAVGKISGAVGTYALCPPSIERRVCELLSLAVAPVSNQIIQRDSHAFVIGSLALLGTTVERMATEIRHLQRTEVREAWEPFRKGQKGSSAMPHKKNPILSERLCGMARLLRGYAATSLENVALWHERDISHSSAERILWPDAFHLAHYMLCKAQGIIRELPVDPQRMEQNLELTRGLVFSQRVLLALVEEGGMSREEAYRHVQGAALRCWQGEGDFKTLLAQDPPISAALPGDHLDRLFDAGFYLRHVDTIFQRFPRAKVD